MRKISGRPSENNLLNKADLISKNIISSASDLTLDKFIVCLCDNDLSVLVINWDYVTEDDIKKAWNNIRNEYISVLKDKQQIYLYELSKEVNLLEFKIQQINLCVKYLSIEPNTEVLNELKKLVPVSGSFNPSDAQQYIKDLQLVINQSKRLIIQLDEKRKELEELMPKQSGVAISKEYFDKLIVQVSKYMHFQVVKQTTTVTQFANMISDMKMMAEAIKKEYEQQ